MFISLIPKLQSYVFLSVSLCVCLSVCQCAVRFGLFAVLNPQVPLFTTDEALSRQGTSEIPPSQVTLAGTSASQKTQNAVIHELPYLKTEQFEFATNLFNIHVYITSMLVV